MGAREYIISTSDYMRLMLTGEPLPDDSEEVVRCRDCKYFYRFDSRCSKFTYDNGAMFASAIVEPDGFCAWGEPKVVGE